MAEKNNYKGLRINEALQHLKLITGKELTQQELGSAIRPDMTTQSVRIRMNRLNTGGITSPEIREVRGICEKTGVDANYLFNISPMDKTPEP